MNLGQIIDYLRLGKRITPDLEECSVYYKMCSGEVIVMLNTKGCNNDITAIVENVITLEEFIKQFNYLPKLAFKIYEEN